MTRRRLDETNLARVARSNGRKDVQHAGEIISIRPVTPLKAAEALRESEARLHALLSSLDDLVFELDENGIYLAIWTTNETLLIAPSSELLGRTVREALGEKVGRRLTLAVRRVLKTGQAELFEYLLDVPAGARCFEGRLAPIVGSASSNDLPPRAWTSQIRRSPKGHTMTQRGASCT